MSDPFNEVEPPSKHERFLIVEDEASVAQDLQIQIRRIGYHVVGRTVSGEDAIVLAESLRPDLILMDVKLSGQIDGIEAANTIRNRFDIPTIFLTAFADDDSLKRAISTEPYGYVLKPYSKQELNLALDLAVLKRRWEAERLRARRILEEADLERRNTLKWYTSVFETVPSGLVVFGVDGSIADFNPSAEKILGMQKDSVVGRQNKALQWDAFSPAGHLSRGKPHPIQQSLEHGVSVRDLEMEFRKNDGSTIWVLINTEPIRAASGAITHAVVGFSEITLQREIQYNRRKMADRLKAAVAASRMVLWEWNIVRGEFTVSTYGSNCILGLSEDNMRKISAQEWIELTHPEDRASVESSLHEALAGRTSIWSVDHRLKAADGSWRWVRQIGRVTERSEDRKPEYMVGTTQDEHDNFLSEEESRLTARRLQIALADSKIGVWSYNLQSEKFVLDERTYEIFGLKNSAPVPRKRVLRFIHPEDISSVLRDVAFALGEASRFECTFRIVRTDGSFRYIRSVGSAQTDRNGILDWISGIAEDVTEKLAVRLEHSLESELLAQAAKSARLGVWRYGLQDQKLIWNKRMLEIFGVDSTPSLEEFMAFVHPDDRAKVADTEKNARVGVSDERIEFRIVNREGTVIHLQNEMSIHLGSDGRPEWLAGISQDCTEQHLSRERQRARESDLARSQKLETIGTFAGGIAHDFNNLLMVILGFVDLAVDRVKGDHVSAELLQNAKAGAVRARDLVKHLLIFARKGPDFVRETFDVVPVVTEAASLLSTLVPANVEILTEYLSPEVFVLGDPGQIHQVLMNLGVNASHAIGNKPGTLKFCVQTSARGLSKNGFEECVCITVVDSGCGMTDDTKSKIFDPFFTTKGRNGGTGLGLSIAHGIVSDHHGCISVESNLGKGTAFTIVLPIASAKSTSPRSDDRCQRLEGRNRRILVIDDRAEIRKIIKTALQNFDFEVIACNGGEAGIEELVARSGVYSAVLLDLAMPGVDGVQVLEVLSQKRPNLPVVLMSGNYDDFNATHYANIENICRLPKPFTVNELVRGVRQAIERC